MSHGPDRGSRRPKADLVDDTLHTVFIAGSWPISALAIIGLCALFGPAPAVAAASGASNILPGLPDTASINACLSRAAVSCSASASRTQSGDDPPEVQQPEISTAFAINAKGEFLTNYHAVASCAALRANISGSWLDAHPVVRNANADLAVIRVTSDKAVPVLRFRDGRPIRPADPVIVMGFPYAGLLTKDPQVTTGVVSALAGLRDDRRYLQLSAPVQPGSSGGPLLDFSGNVVGVVAAKLNKFAAAEWTGLPGWIGTLPENVNFAIKSDNALEFLGANGVEHQKASSTAKLDPADIGELAANSVIMIKCE
jgi:uncharacterized protein